MADNEPRGKEREEKSLDEWIEEVFRPLKDIIYDILANISKIIEETA